MTCPLSPRGTGHRPFNGEGLRIVLVSPASSRPAAGTCIVLTYIIPVCTVHSWKCPLHRPHRYCPHPGRPHPHGPHRHWAYTCAVRISLVCT